MAFFRFLVHTCTLSFLIISTILVMQLALVNVAGSFSMQIQGSMTAGKSPLVILLLPTWPFGHTTVLAAFLPPTYRAAHNPVFPPSLRRCSIAMQKRSSQLPLVQKKLIR
ncbi:hypothetical protein Patl1_15024 [Pistacia atlantica]|uniref:Uncharacterized protein n=1 Tax=Pistacia atlantica TaxID=434234 RepID=A0ACC1B5W8_9ROSI|nr:hypothetical protein Patl1_15024 [Pistacia atlantica]